MAGIKPKQQNKTEAAIDKLITPSAKPVSKKTRLQMTEQLYKASMMVVAAEWRHLYYIHMVNNPNCGFPHMMFVDPFEYQGQKFAGLAIWLKPFADESSIAQENNLFKLQLRSYMCVVYDSAEDVKRLLTAMYHKPDYDIHV